MTDVNRVLPSIERSGGSAYPSTLQRPDGGTVTRTGLTVGEWCAGRVGATVMAKGLKCGMSFSEMAVDAYALADAMLAEGQKPCPPNPAPTFPATLNQASRCTRSARQSEICAGRSASR